MRSDTRSSQAHPSATPRATLGQHLARHRNRPCVLHRVCVRFRRESVLTPQMSAQSFSPKPYVHEAMHRIAVLKQVDSAGYDGCFRHNLQVCGEAATAHLPPAGSSPDTSL